MNHTRAIRAALIATIATLPATTILADDLVDEAAAWADAVAAARRAEPELEPLRLYIERYPASLHYAAAILELERAELLDQLAYALPDGVAEPELRHLTPTDEHLAWFYQGQNALAGADTLSDATRQRLRARYKGLWNMDDPRYKHEADYYLGYLDYIEGKPADALRHFNSLPADAKYDATVPFYKMQCQLATGRWSEAQTTATSLASHTDLTQAQRRELTRVEGECLLHQGQQDAALQKLSQYVSTDGSVTASSAYNCALLAYASGNNTLTQQALRRALGSTSDVWRSSDASTLKLRQAATLLLGQSCAATADYDQARIAFEQAAAMDADPTVAEAAAYNHAVVVHATNYSPFGDEVKLLEAFLNRYPGSPYADRTSEYLTEVYMTSRNYEAALESAARIKNPTPAIQQAKARLLYQLGVQEYVNGDFARADQRLSECINIGSVAPNLGEAYYWRGEARYHRGQYYLAESDFAKAAADGRLTAAATLPTQYALGYARFQQQHWADAAEAFARHTADITQRGSDTYADALTRLGDCAYYQRQFAEAETRYRQAREAVQSGMGDYAMFQEAFVQGLQKKYADKVATLQRLIADYPSSARVGSAWLEIGKTHLQTGNNANAIHAFQQAMQQLDGAAAPQAAVQLAMTYNNMGQVEAAERTYKQVVERWPTSDEASTALEDLKTIYLDRNDVGGYDTYLASVHGGTGLSASERDSLNLRSANRLLADGKHAEAHNVLRTLLAQTTDTDLRRAVLPTAMTLASELGQNDKVLADYAELSRMQGIDPRVLQNALLLAAKAHMANGDTQSARTALEQASADVRTAAGAEAKYLLAQGLMDAADVNAAETTAKDLIQQGTPHQYWLARAIILLSDIERSRGNVFQAEQYLKSLQNNYTADDDIAQRIAERLANNE